MPLEPHPVHRYHVFLASPGDVQDERHAVRKFFQDYNRTTAHLWNAEFVVIDWDNYSTIGVGRPQELITQQTLERYRNSLALVVGVMAQRFGSPSGKAESGTEEEFNWALQSHQESGFPEIKWFFRKVENLTIPAAPAAAQQALEQWQKVLAFRKRLQDFENPVFDTEYPGAAGFAEVFRHDLEMWLADPARPWAAERTARLAALGPAAAAGLPVAFDGQRYQAAVLKRYDALNFEMLDTSGAFYSGVRLWNVFVPQSVRECHEYNPRLLEIPKEHQKRLLEAGEITAEELALAEQQADRQRQYYFQQPLRPVLDVVDESFRSPGSPTSDGAAIRAGASAARRLVILGDPGSGKSSLIRYLALRWARISEPQVRDAQPIPLVIELGAYARWQCEGRKDFVRYLEQGPVWHEWPDGVLGRLLEPPGRVVLLLDGLDEVFDIPTRESVMNDIQRFTSQFPHIPILVTSRVVGYQSQRLRDADFRHFMLHDLTAEQITTFVERWHEETFDDPAQAAPKRDRLQKAIRESKSIAMLAGNPLLLTMMAILNRNQELPRDRADLYAQASRVLLFQWDTERALADFPGMSAEIGLREKTDILRRVAAHMQANSSGLKGNLIDGPTLIAVIEDYLQTELRFAQSRAVARAVVEHLRQRNFILCFVGADSYAFVHRTFLEYFCAADFVHQFNIAKTLDLNGLIAVFDQHCRDDEWREVLRLICGQIDESFVGQIIDRLATRTDLSKWDGEGSLPELPLAVWCLSEARNIQRLESTGRKLAEVLLRVYIPGGGAKDFHDQLLASAREHGTRWPGDNPLCETVLTREAEVDEEKWASVYLPKYLDCLHPDRNSTERLARSVKYGLRWGSLEVLAEKWADEKTRTLLAERATSDTHGGVRSAALRALAQHWPDDVTRALMTERALQDEDGYVRSVALQALAQHWPDEKTRILLTERALQADYGEVRGASLEVLAQHWPDESTRALLIEFAVVDRDIASCRAALRALAQQWPDESTRALLIERAVGDRRASARRVALQAIAQHWPDEKTRALMTERAVQDENDYVRMTMLQALVQHWPDERTRALLTFRAVKDGDNATRRAALQALAQQWPDAVTRAFMTERAVQDEGGDVRRVALQALAQIWPDESTRALLTDRACKDCSTSARRTSLQALAHRWPDESTRALLTERALMDDDADVRGGACVALGELHSNFGRILPTKDLDGIFPYLDPWKPIPREHIERAAAKCGIRPEEIDATVASLSAHLGWDVTRGARPSED